ncbi:hypothetical protein [Saprospira grandis]|uniref:hypothetical protein n=1 Tax=Saprospira grandis TaxID=1008 RepID=UPI0022DDBBA5|nr:hypothetical protein [Saprospira grandis]WBM74910.1 hypothetical protein OP864_01465 [Saprospira grandis]
MDPKQEKKKANKDFSPPVRSSQQPWASAQGRTNSRYFLSLNFFGGNNKRDFLSLNFFLELFYGHGLKPMVAGLCKLAG